MKKIYLLLVCISLSSSIFSQKEANNWIFGFSQMIDFNTDPPTTDIIPTFDFFAERNTVSHSDEEGNLLFYSEGTTLFNRNFEAMPNGMDLLGEFSGSHPVFVIPKPNSTNKFYLITSTMFQGSFGLNWSEIDMSLDGGFGDITNTKNINLTENCNGKITAALHSNLEDIWIISHELNSNTYDAWLATDTGISSTPVSSSVGSFISDSNFNNNLGQIKTSLAGDKIAAVYQGINLVEVFDFDRSTGNLGNAISLTTFTQPYGVEFSPNGKYIYVSQNGSNFLNGLKQLDIEAGNASQVQATSTTIGLPINVQAGGLQLGPDGKIYTINTVFDFFLGTINNPNEQGSNSNFVEQGIELPFTEILFGLPSFYHGFLQKPFFTYSGLCLGGLTEFTIDQFEFTIDSVEWEFGDPLSGLNNFSTELNPIHEFTTSGPFQVKLIVYSNGEAFSNSSIVNIAPTSIDLGVDQIVCANEVITLNAYTPNAEYIWSTGQTSSSILTASPGTFTVEVTVDTCGVLIDEITIGHIPAPDVELGNNVMGLCNGTFDTLDVTDSTPGATYLWDWGQSTSTSPILTVTTGGIYNVTVTYPNGCFDTDNVEYIFDEVIVNPSQANLDCFDDSSGVALVFPELGSLPFTYQWSNGDTLYTTNGLSASTYTITVTDNLGCTTTQEFNLTEPPELILDIVINDDNPSTPAPDGVVFLNPTGGAPPYIFEWDAFGVHDDPLFNIPGGDYNITITDDDGCETIVDVTVGGVPTNIHEISLLEKIELFPNPTSDFLFVKIPKEVDDDNLEFSLINPLGQTMSDFFMEKNNEGLKVDVSNFQSGIYFLKIKKGEKEKIWKVNVIK